MKHFFLNWRATRRERKRGEEEEEKKKEERKVKKVRNDTCFGLYGTTLDVRISFLAFDLSRVLLGISLLTLYFMRVGLGKKN